MLHCRPQREPQPGRHRGRQGSRKSRWPRRVASGVFTVIREAGISPHKFDRGFT